MALTLTEKTNIREGHTPQTDAVPFYKKLDTAIRKLGADIATGDFLYTDAAMVGKPRATTENNFLEFGIRAAQGLMTKHMVDLVMDRSALDVADVNNETQLTDTTIIAQCKLCVWAVSSLIGTGRI